MAHRHFTEVVLQPGELWFGERDTRIRTLLGSCVSITLWHPHRLLGGMCHYMLPSRPEPRRGELDGRYAEEALQLLLRDIDGRRTEPGEYVVKMFGGGNMFPGTTRSGVDHVGLQNVDAGKELLRTHGFRCHAEHLGGCGHRQLIFDVWNGDVWMKHTATPVGERGT